MAYSTRPRYNKDGDLFSYEIRVDRGRDAEGKRMKPYTMTWRVPEGFTSAKKIQMELNSVAGQFEADCRAGKILTKEERKAKARADAERAERERLEQSRKYTFSRFANEVFLVRKETELCKRTIDTYAEMLKRINKYLGDFKLEDIRSSDVNTFLTALKTKEFVEKKTGKGRMKIVVTDEPLSYSAIRLHYIVLKSVFQMAYDDGIIGDNPMFKVKCPKQNKDDRAERDELGALSVEEAQRLLSCMENEPLQWRIFVRLMLDTGIRRGEAVGLTWDCVHFDRNEIEIKHNVTYTASVGVSDEAPKSGRYRTLPVDVEIMQMLRELKKTQTDYSNAGIISLNKYVFQQANGDCLNPTTPTAYFARIGRKYGFNNLHPHMLRHSYATIGIIYGADVASISENLGHASKSITLNIYTHADEEAKRRASQIAREALKARKRA